MPSSAVRAFTDPDEYAASIRQGTVDLTVTERGHFAAKITRIDLHRLWMQRFSENYRGSRMWRAGADGQLSRLGRSLARAFCEAAWKCNLLLSFVTARVRATSTIHRGQLPMPPCRYLLRMWLRRVG